MFEDCISEFGPHDDHSDCDRMLAVMRGDDDVVEQPDRYNDVDEFGQLRWVD